MKQLKKWLSLVLCCSMLLSQIPGAAFASNAADDSAETAVSVASDTAVENVCGENLTWAVDGHMLTISGEGVMYDYDDIAPWGEAFGYEIRTVVLEEGVTHVGNRAFFGNPTVGKIVIHGDPPTWGEDVLYPYFGGCSSVTVFFPEKNSDVWTEEAIDAATAAGVSAFAVIDESTSGQSGYVDWRVSDGVLTIEPRSDEECPMEEPLFLYQMDEIHTIEINNRYGAITSICGSAFSSLPYVDRVIFCGDCPSFGTDCFYGNEVLFYPANNETWTQALDSLPSGDWVPYTDAASGTFGYSEDTMFSWDLEGTTLTISGTGGMPNMGSWHNYPWSIYSRQIETLVFGEGITSLADYCFGVGGAAPAAIDSANPDYAIQNITFPSTLTYIGEYAFYGCQELTSVAIPKNVTEIGYYAFSNCTALGDLTFESRTGPIILGNGVFENCISLTEVTLPCFDSSDGSYTFAGCTGLSSVTFTNGITDILYSMFIGCTALKTVEFPASLESIANNAFAYSGLTDVTIPTTMTQIGDYAFYCCEDLESVTFDALELGDDAATTVIGDQAFADCTALQSVALPICELGAYVFAGCTSLESASTYRFTENLGVGMFYGCTALTDVHITRTIYSIAAEAFYGCTALEKLIIPPYIDTVYENAFADSGLKYVVYGGTPTRWNSIVIHDGNDPMENAVVILGENEEENWYVTTDYTLVVTGGVFDGVNQGVDTYGDKRAKILTIQLGPEVTDITSGAIYKYTNAEFTGVTVDEDNPNFQVGDGYILSGDGKRLIYCQPNTTYITIPTTVTSVDNYAFADCAADTTVYFLGNAPTLDTNALSKAPTGLTFRIDPNTTGWAYPTWNGITVDLDRILIEELSLSADSLTGETVTLTASTKYGVSVLLHLFYSFDGKDWRTMTSQNTKELAYTFAPSSLNIPEDTTTVWFGISVGELEISDTIQVPVNIAIPAPITGLTVKETGINVVTLGWDMIPEKDYERFSHFLVERKTEDGEYETLATIYPDGNNTVTCGINDTGVSANTTYQYRVFTVFTNGYAGVGAEITATTLADNVKPEITSLTPASRRYNENFTVTARASDNDALSSIQLAYSTDAGVTWNVLTTAEGSGKSAQASADVDISKLPDGELRVRAVATDRSGNVSAEYAVGYVLDRAAPAAPANVAAEAKGTTVVAVTWDAPAGADLYRFKLYHSLSGEDGSWAVLASVSANGYTNSGLTPDTTYYYKVTAVDTTGNESASSSVVSITTPKDTTAPANVSITPAGGSTFGPGQTIRAAATDETALSTLTIYYRAAGAEEWTAYKNLSTAATSAELKTTLGTLASGTYELKSTAVDAAGNSTDSAAVTYTLDCDAPVVSDVAAVAGTEQVTVTWNSGNESDLAGFHIYRGNAKAGSVSAQNKESYSFTDTLPWNLCGTSYTYRVVALDKYGNQSTCDAASAVTPAASADTTAPEAYMTMVSSTVTGDANRFSAAGSYDERAIASYAWDLGDGGRSSAKSFSYTYQTAGEYTVTLTVTDTSGNRDTVTGTITVIDAEGLATPKVTVLGYETNTPDVTTPLNGAQVVFDLGGENISYYTGASGKVEFRRAESGSFTIGAYMDGYLPASADVTLVSGEAVEVTLKLEKKPVVSGELTTKELTYQEIKDLGIDVSDPDNQNVYQFSASINIGGNITEYSYYYNDAGVVSGGVEVQTVQVGDSTYTIKPHVATVTRPTSSGGNGSGATVPEEVTIPYVTVLEIPGTVKVLKQFYEAELTVMNQADAEFAFIDSRATLHIPDGLTLIPTETAPAATVTMGSDGTIYGQCSTSVRWILRGDAPGEYDLSASFDATLRDFDAAITAEFQAENSIVVRDPSEVNLDMFVSNTMLDRTFFVDLKLYCETGTLNLPEITLGEYEPAQIAVYNTEGKMKILEEGETVTELKPDETLVYSYKITVDESVPLLFESNILKGKLSAPGMTVNTYTRNITKFALFKDNFDLTEFGVFVKTLPTMSEDEALSFWRFINNTKDGVPGEHDMCYRILSGKLDDYDGTIEELRMEILTVFETIRAQLNTYVDDSSYELGYLTNAMAESMWEQLGIDDGDSAWEAASKDSLEKLFKDVKKWLCELKINDTDIKAIQQLNIAYSNIEDIYETLSNLIFTMQSAVQAVGMGFHSEYAGRYAYFNYYLNHRLDYETPSDPIFQVLLDNTKFALVDKYWAGGIINMTSWITGGDSWTNHTDTIERWAEILYQFEVVALYYDNGDDTQDARRITIAYRSSDESYAPKNSFQTFAYDWAWFEQSSSAYNQKLAALTLGMTMAGSSTPDTDERYSETIPIGEGDRAQNIRLAYQDLGFADDTYYNYEEPLSTTADKVAFSIAHRVLNSGDTLVAVFLRGGQYGAEWSSNFNLGSVDDHKGFDTAATEVANELRNYLDDHGLTGVKVWMSGYSRSAATANIAAHRILKDGLVEQDDLFVYTFATPSGYYVPQGEAEGDTPEANIFNIVSPHDVVPKVALTNWGFSKYGRTLVLPTDVSTIQNAYRNLAGAELGVTAGTRYMTELLEEFLAAVVTDRHRYVGYVQDDLTALLADATTGSLDSITPILDVVVDVVLAAMSDDISVNDRIRAQEIFAAWKECKDNGFTVLKAHYMEYYLTWLKYGDLDEISDYEDQYVVRSICVECPVDVEVYDTKNNLVAHIKDNQVLVSRVPADVVGEAKVVYLYDQEYRVVLTGTGDGTMTYTIREYDADELIRIIRYYDVPLADGTQYTQQITDGTLSVITAQDQSTISADEDSQSTAVPGKYRIGVVNGETALSAAAPGTEVTVTAYATLDGEEFAYWRYESDDANFALPQSTQQTVTFTMPDGAVRLEAKYGDAVQVNGGTLQVSGTTATITADADSDGMTFLRWEILSQPEGMKNVDLTQNPVSFQIPDGEVSIQAIFTPVDSAANGAPETDDSYAIIHAPSIAADRSVSANFAYLRKDNAAVIAVCAFYNEAGVLVGTDIQSMRFGVQTLTFQSEAEFVSAKLFVLDSVSTLRPLCRAKSVS